MIKGCDISEFQGNINIDNLKSAGLKFCIIRIGEDDFYDARAEDNILKCQRAGIPWGAYWFSDAIDEKTAVHEAFLMVQFLKLHGFVPDVGLWYDMEDSPVRQGQYFRGIDLANIAYAACEYLEDAGYYAGIYCNSYYHDMLYPYCERFDCWYALWDEDPNYCNVDATIKQYDVIETELSPSGELDMDVCYADLNIYKVKSAPEKPKQTLKEKLQAVIKELENLTNEI